MTSTELGLSGGWHLDTPRRELLPANAPTMPVILRQQSAQHPDIEKSAQCSSQHSFVLFCNEKSKIETSELQKASFYFLLIVFSKLLILRGKTAWSV